MVKKLTVLMPVVIKYPLYPDLNVGKDKFGKGRRLLFSFVYDDKLKREERC
ncbi:hypothetical protein BMS3Bbin06_01417 [bacterium BMS3Bbin06]|nr:hypothetical protein BMS3Abin08_01640 [bacterium BMS3Abin08]GBE34883.1 hypothetical protein BMS3Bbin06_01417 [bacterium BMS3Bbin06]